LENLIGFFGFRKYRPTFFIFSLSAIAAGMIKSEGNIFLQ